MIPCIRIEACNSSTWHPSCLAPFRQNLRAPPARLTVRAPLPALPPCNRHCPHGQLRTDRSCRIRRQGGRKLAPGISSRCNEIAWATLKACDVWVQCDAPRNTPFPFPLQADHVGPRPVALAQDCSPWCSARRIKKKGHPEVTLSEIGSGSSSVTRRWCPTPRGSRGGQRFGLDRLR